MSMTAAVNVRCVKADFHLVEFSERTENLLFARESIALNLNRILRVINFLLCKIPSARKILQSGNQPSLGRAHATKRCRPPFIDFDFTV